MRRPIETDITFESESQFYSGFSENLRPKGGIFVATHVLPLGAPGNAPVAVVFTRPGQPSERKIRVEEPRPWITSTPRRATCQARDGVIEFGSLGTEEIDVIRRFCTQRSPLFFEDRRAAHAPPRTRGDDQRLG